MPRCAGLGVVTRTWRFQRSPGIKINTNETVKPGRSSQRWTGSTWELFGEVLDGDPD